MGAFNWILSSFRTKCKIFYSCHYASNQPIENNIVQKVLNGAKLFVDRRYTIELEFFANALIARFE